MHCCQNLVQQKAMIIYEQTLWIFLNHLKARECLSIGGWINKVHFWSLIEKYAHCENVKQWAYKFWDGKPYHMELMKKGKNQKSVFLTGIHILGLRLMNSEQSVQSLCCCPCSISCSGQECGVFTWSFFWIAYPHWMILIILFVIW